MVTANSLPPRPVFARQILPRCPLSKYFRITERMRLEFRMEAYNLSNTFIPTGPVTTITSATFGKSVNRSNKGREMQYTARLHF